MTHWEAIKAQLTTDALAVVPGAVVFFGAPRRALPVPSVVFSNQSRRDPRGDLATVRGTHETINLTAEIRLPLPDDDEIQLAVIDKVRALAERVEPTTTLSEPLATWSPYAGVVERSTVTGMEDVLVEDDRDYIAGRLTFTLEYGIGK